MTSFIASRLSARSDAYTRRPHAAAGVQPSVWKRRRRSGTFGALFRRRRRARGIMDNAYKKQETYLIVTDRSVFGLRDRTIRKQIDNTDGSRARPRESRLRSIAPSSGGLGRLSLIKRFTIFIDSSSLTNEFNTVRRALRAFLFERTQGPGHPQNGGVRVIRFFFLHPNFKHITTKNIVFTYGLKSQYSNRNIIMYVDEI